MKLKMVCEGSIGQFTVTKAGLYAWRSKQIRNDDGTNWTLGVCREGAKFEGQFEGCGPITWQTVEE